MTILLALMGVANAQSCGDTLTTSVTLTADVVCPPGHTGHVLRINANNVTINGNGFKLIGAGVGTTSSGVLVNGRSNAQIINLTVQGVTNGINLVNTDNAIVATVNASGLTRGVTSSGGNHNLELVNVNVSNSTTAGMNLVGTDSNLTLELNNFTGAREALILNNASGPWTLSSSFGNVFSGNANLSNSDDVIVITSADDITVSGLNLSGSGVGRGVLVTSSTNVTITGVDASGRHRGIQSSGTGNTNLEIANNDVSDSADFGIYLVEVDNQLGLSNNILDRSDQGVYIQGLVGGLAGWAFPTTNSFDDVPFASDSDDVIELHDVSDVTIANLDLSASTAGRGHAIRLEDAVDVTVDTVIADNRRMGVVLGTDNGTNDGLILRNSSFQNATLRAIDLQYLGDSPTLEALDVSGSANGVFVDNTNILAGITLDLSDILFTGVPSTANNYRFRAEDSSFLTVQNLTADDMTFGRAIHLVRVDDSSIQGLTVCGATQGLDIDDCNDVTIGSAGIGVSTTAININSATDATVGTVSVLGNSTNLVNSGTNTAISLPPLSDADSNGIPDICDSCPGDPFNDQDNDGLCPDVDDDDDGDGVLDVNDPVIDDPAICGDSDGDTCDDCSVASFFSPANDGLDSEGDGLCDAGDPDDDDDLVLDGSDPDPLDAFVCGDSELDGCDDCNLSGSFDPNGDGPDTDGDTVCDPADMTILATGVFDSADVGAWSPGGAGSPSVVYDSASGLLVMVYESRTGSNADCPVGTWGIGLATSPDGVNWTDQGSLLNPIPQSGTYYECVAAHPTVVNRFPGVLRVFFKTEQGLTPTGTPPWGTGQYTGIGRLSLTWGGSSYSATAPDATPALSIGQNFGYPKAIYADSQYKVALSRRPDMMVATGPAPGNFLSLGGVVWSPGDADWTPDEVISPAPVCPANAGEDFTAFVGGRDLGTGSVVLDGFVGRLASSDFLTWSEALGPLFTTQVGDVEMRHWDAVRVSPTDYLLFFSELNGPGGTPQVGVAQTTGGWVPSDVQSKVCP